MPEWYQFPKDDTEIRFVTFHSWNPHVYRGIVTRAFQLLAGGAKKFGIALIYNNMRWENAISTTGEIYKLPNDFMPLYARLLIHDHPVFKGVVEIRRRFKK